MIITNEKTLREYYELLTAINNNEDLRRNDSSKYVIAKLKDAIREYYRRENNRNKSTMINVDYDRYIEIVTAPDDVDDLESWFMNCIFQPRCYSYYDCTGYPFTMWHKFAKRQGKNVVYHCVCFDV